MPDKQAHLRIDRLLLGKEYPFVHETLDAATQVLGPHHRRYTHNQETVLAIFLRSGGDLGALVAAEAHILADREYSRSKKILSDLLFPRGKRYSFKRRRR